jgi:hypothetical protein
MTTKTVPEGKVRKDGRFISPKKSEAAKQNPALRAWIAAVKTFKKTAGIKEGEFYAIPAKGTVGYKAIRKIYDELMKK